MEHHVSNFKLRILFILVVFIAVQNSTMKGQTRVPPQFLSGKEESKNYMKLRNIINNISYNSPSSNILPNCFQGIGTFSFEVTHTGIVDIVNFSGNLPPKIIAEIKQNILSTSGKWIPQLDDGKPVNSLPFILIYYVNFSCDNMPTYQNNEFLISMLLEKAINSNENQKFTILNNSYLLPVEGVNIMRH